MIPEFPNEADVKIVSNGLNKFAYDIYQAIAKETSGNLFFSPFSISAAVAMVHMGTCGNTEEEIKNVVYFPVDKQCIWRAFQDFITDYKKIVSHYQLNTTNMAYISEKLIVKESFISALKATFLATSKTVNFDDSEVIRQEINDAVKNETESRIQDIIPAGILSPLTCMVLVNAVYFKGLWMNQFDPNSTEEKTFWINSEHSINVPMMTMESDFRIAHVKELDAKLLVIDYQGGRISFVIILPNQKNGLSDLERNIVNQDLTAMEKCAVSQNILVSIPKFKLEKSFDLVTTLQAMGIKDLFSQRACNLSGISDNSELFVSNIIHKAFLEVNEEGSEAAAATVVTIQATCYISPSPSFIADHPFLFYICYKASDTIFFMGRYTKPEF